MDQEQFEKKFFLQEIQKNIAEETLLRTQTQKEEAENRMLEYKIQLLERKLQKQDRKQAKKLAKKQAANQIIENQ
jgi:hypothetical protein